MLHRNKIKKYLLLLIAAQLFLAQANLVYAQVQNDYSYNYASSSGVEAQIRTYLCTPSQGDPNSGVFYPGGGLGGRDSGPSTNDLYNCVNKLYRFAIAFGSIIAIFFIVIAGYLYMSADGSQETVDKAKSIFISSITAMVILFAGYVLLRAINPDLLKFTSIQPPSIKNIATGYCPTGSSDNGKGQCAKPDGTIVAPVSGGAGTGSGGAGGACVTTEQNGCTQATISQCPAMAQNMDAALRACNQESMGGKIAIGSTTDKCTETTTNQVVSFSWGLWQINVTNSTSPEFPECNGVLKATSGPWSTTCVDGTTCGRTCTFGSGGQAAFNSCIQALADPARNTKQACTLFNRSNNGGWGPWPYTRRVCQLP